MSTPKTDEKALRIIQEFGPNNGQRFAAMCDFARELERENARLRDFAGQFAMCPCCDEYESCLDGCTYEEDCASVGHSEDYERMIAARKALE